MLSENSSPFVTAESARQFARPPVRMYRFASIWTRLEMVCHVGTEKMRKGSLG